MELITRVLKDFKSVGFLNSRINGTHPGSVVSVGGVSIKLNVKDYLDLDLSHMGFTRAKVSQLIRSYYDPETVSDWLTRIKFRRGFGSIDADEVFFPHGSHGHDRGPCITAIGFRETRIEPPTLTCFSRSSEFPHKWFADLWSLVGFYHLLGVEELNLTWFISLLWMDARAANYLRVMKVPVQPPYSSFEKFNFRVEEQWDKFVTTDVAISYSLLKNLRRLHRGTKPLVPLTPEYFGSVLTDRGL